jgi:hypothetical protein
MSTYRDVPFVARALLSLHFSTVRWLNETDCTTTVRHLAARNE